MVVRSERGRRRDRLDRFLIFEDGDGECSIVYFLGVVLLFAVAAESVQLPWSIFTLFVGLIKCSNFELTTVCGYRVFSLFINEIK